MATSKIKRVKDYRTERVRLTLPAGHPGQSDAYIEIVPGGEQTYLWVGTDAKYYAATEPPSKRALRTFAQEILRTLEEPNDE